MKKITVEEYKVQKALGILPRDAYIDDDSLLPGFSDPCYCPKCGRSYLVLDIEIYEGECLDPSCDGQIEKR